MTLNSLKRLEPHGKFLEACYQSKSVPGGMGHIMGLFAEIYKSDFGADVCLHCAASAMNMINRLGYAWENEKHLLNEQYERESATNDRPPETIDTGTTTIHRGVQQPKDAPLPESSPKKRGRPFEKKG